MLSDKQIADPQTPKSRGRSLTNPHKKQIYVWPENLEFFNGLRNKSRLLNLLMKKYKEETDADGESNT